MRAIITGQIGLDKRQYLEETAAIAASRGGAVKIYHIGEMMYREAPDVPRGRILDLPLARLNSLRRAVFRDVLADAPRHPNVIVNTHATFRWKHGLFAAFDFDQLAQFQADTYLTLVDNIETIHARMLRDHEFEHTLKDLIVWREEEILATEILAKVPGAGTVSPKFFVLSRGRHKPTCETLFRLLFRPNMRKVYPSFPMSHVMDLPETLAEIDAFRAAMGEKFITFDPGDVDEKVLADSAIEAARSGKQTLTVGGMPDGAPPLALKVSDILQIVPDIDGQIYSRDFLLVRQSDIIVSYIPELPSPTGRGAGKPGLSSGVERELQHAHEHGKDVYVIWKPRKAPSPFVTQTANKIFRSVEEALAFFEEKGFLQPYNLFGG